MKYVEDDYMSWDDRLMATILFFYALSNRSSRKKETIIEERGEGRKVKLMIEGDGMTQDDFLIHSFLVFVHEKDGSFFVVV
jgi:hypothetical protein